MLSDFKVSICNIFQREEKVLLSHRPIPINTQQLPGMYIERCSETTQVQLVNQHGHENSFIVQVLLRKYNVLYRLPVSNQNYIKYWNQEGTHNCLECGVRATLEIITLFYIKGISGAIWRKYFSWDDTVNLELSFPNVQWKIMLQLLQKKIERTKHHVLLESLKSQTHITFLGLKKYIGTSECKNIERPSSLFKQRYNCSTLQSNCRNHRSYQ